MEKRKIKFEVKERFLDGLILKCFNIDWDDDHETCKTRVIVNYITNELAEIICPKCKSVKYMTLSRD